MDDREERHKKFVVGQEFVDSDYKQSERFPFIVTSAATRRYNCAAWAVHIDDLWIQPPRSPQTYTESVYHWPEELVLVKANLEGYKALYAHYGFEECDNGDLEPGYEKIALFYKKSCGIHVARQLSDGKWTAKMGPGVDVSHDIRACVAGMYDHVEQYMRRLGTPKDNPFPGRPYERTGKRR